MHPYQYIVIEFFLIQNKGVICYNMSHTSVIYSILIEQILSKLVYPEELRFFFQRVNITIFLCFVSYFES